MIKLCMIFQQVDENQTEETPVVEKKKKKSTTKKSKKTKQDVASKTTVQLLSICHNRLLM